MRVVSLRVACLRVLRRRLDVQCCQILKECFEPLPDDPPAANPDAAKELSITYGPFSFEDLCKEFDERPTTAPAWHTLVGESAVAAEPSLVDCTSPTVVAAAAAPSAATLSSVAPLAAAAASEPAALQSDPAKAVPSGDDQI